MRGIAMKLLSATVLTGAGAAAVVVPLTLIEAGPDTPIEISAPLEERTAVVRIQVPSAHGPTPPTERPAAATVEPVALEALPHARLARRTVRTPEPTTPKPSLDSEPAAERPLPQPPAAPAVPAPAPAPAPAPPPPTQVARVAAAVKTEPAEVPAPPKPGRRLGHLKRAAQLAPARSAAAILGRHPSGKPKHTPKPTPEATPKHDAKPPPKAKPTPNAKPDDERRGGRAVPPPAPAAPPVAPAPPQPQQRGSGGEGQPGDKGNGGETGDPSASGSGGQSGENGAGGGHGNGGKKP